MKPPRYGFLYWPMAALYALFWLEREGGFERPHFISDWLGYTVMAAVALLPPLMLGYLVGRMEGHRSQAGIREPTEAERNEILWKLTLPWWRRVGGHVCMAAGALALFPFLALAMRYGKGSGWAFLAALVASFAALGAGVKLGEWFWKPYREAQSRRRQAERQGNRLS